MVGVAAGTVDGRGAGEESEQGRGGSGRNVEERGKGEDIPVDTSEDPMTGGDHGIANSQILYNCKHFSALMEGVG